MGPKVVTLWLLTLPRGQLGAGGQVIEGSPGNRTIAWFMLLCRDAAVATESTQSPTGSYVLSQTCTSKKSRLSVISPPSETVIGLL